MAIGPDATEADTSRHVDKTVRLDVRRWTNEQPIAIVWVMAIGCSCVPRGAWHGGNIPEGIGGAGGWLTTHGKKQAQAGQCTVDSAPAQALLKQVRTIGQRLLGRRCTQVPVLPLLCTLLLHFPFRHPPGEPRQEAPDILPIQGDGACLQLPRRAQGLFPPACFVPYAVVSLVPCDSALGCGIVSQRHLRIDHLAADELLGDVERFRAIGLQVKDDPPLRRPSARTMQRHPAQRKARPPTSTAAQSAPHRSHWEGMLPQTVRGAQAGHRSPRSSTAQPVRSWSKSRGRNAHHPCGWLARRIIGWDGLRAPQSQQRLGRGIAY